MGCDGGTIPKRDELVRTKKKPEQKDKTSELAFRWKHCAVSQEPLQPPVVACELGRMYNKEAIIEGLLDKSKATDMISHLKSIKEVKDLKFTENPDWVEDDSTEKGDGYIDSHKSKWICPIVGQEMNGKFRFVFIWTCGCVMSERAIKQLASTVKNDTLECLKCQKPFIMSDVITLNPTEDAEIQMARDRMEVRREKAKNEKKNKKNKNGVTSASATATVSASASSGGETIANGSKPERIPSHSGDSKSLNPLKTKIKEEAEEKDAAGPSLSKKSRLVASASSSSSGPSISNGKANLDSRVKSGSKLGGYSVAKDPAASETYKSLFTTHSTAIQQDKAHWITYNPFYN